ncbi:MAG: ferrochelatase [Chlorobium sp.]|nr:ferrochelatase [Chlorobium sp.]
MVDGTVSRKKYAVIVTTYGEVEDVTIRNLWPSSRKILKVITRQIVHIPTALIYFIADYRSTKHYIKWKLNHYQSSLLAVNRAQTERLREALAANRSPFLSTIEVDVTDAYYFVSPLLEEKLQQLRSHYDGVVVVPMIPVESAFSCGVACQMVVDSYGESSFSRVRVLSKLWNDDCLHHIYANYLLGQIAAPLQQRKKSGGRIGLVLVIHGTLVKDRAGNPPTLFTGLVETIAFFAAMKQTIMADSRNIFTTVRQGCINHSRGGEWTSETIEKALAEFKAEGYDGVVMFPYGFFADNSETEYDACKKLEEAAFPLSQYVRCINDTPEFIYWLSGKVLDGLQALNNLQVALQDFERRP